MTDNALSHINRLTRWVDGFPIPGVRFADLTPVFADTDGLRQVVDALSVAGESADLVAGIDARGFLLGAGVALTLGTGVLAVRKAGKLPPPVASEEYDLEYGTAQLEVPKDIDLEGRRILVVDDVLATGGTLAAAVKLLTAQGAHVIGAAVVLEIEVLSGRTKLGGLPLSALAKV